MPVTPLPPSQATESPALPFPFRTQTLSTFLSQNYVRLMFNKTFFHCSSQTLLTLLKRFFFSSYLKFYDELKTFHFGTDKAKVQI